MLTYSIYEILQYRQLSDNASHRALQCMPTKPSEETTKVEIK
jgi:hypothetical protein